MKNKLFLFTLVVLLFVSCQNPLNYNEAGRKYYYENEYIRALDSFNYILKNKSNLDITNPLLLSAYEYKAKILFLMRNKTLFNHHFNDFLTRLADNGLTVDNLEIFEDNRLLRETLSWMFIFSSIFTEKDGDEEQAYKDISKSVAFNPTSKCALLRLCYFFIKYNNFEKYSKLQEIINSLESSDLKKDEADFAVQQETLNTFLRLLNLGQKDNFKNELPKLTAEEYSFDFLPVHSLLFEAYYEAFAGSPENVITNLKKYFKDTNITKNDLFFTINNSPFFTSLKENDEYLLFLDSFFNKN